MERKLKQVLSKDQEKLLKFWIGKCSSGKLPQRRDVNPSELLFCLKNVTILEQDESGQFMFRLTGSALKEVLGTECRGKLVSEECGRELPWSEAVRRAAGSRAPVFGTTPIGHRRTHRWMRLPLEPRVEDRQLVLCYDDISFDDTGSVATRETMYAIADLIKRVKPQRPQAAYI